MIGVTLNADVDALTLDPHLHRQAGHHLNAVMRLRDECICRGVVPRVLGNVSMSEEVKTICAAEPTFESYL